MIRALVLLCFLLLASFAFLLQPNLAQADEPTLSVTVADHTRSFTRGELLARPDATTVAAQTSARQQQAPAAPKAAAKQ